MKALKIVGSIFIGGIMFVLLTIFFLITSARILLSGNTISIIATDVFDQTEEIDLGRIFGNDANISAGELDEAIGSLDEYVSREEIYAQFGDMANQIIKYYMGVTDEIDTTEYKKVLEEAAEKYEAKTGEKIDLDEAFSQFDESIKEFEQKIDEDTETPEAVKSLKIIYNNKVYIGVIVGFVILGLLMILINKSAVPLLIHFLIWSILYFIGGGICLVLSKIIPVTEEAGGAITVGLMSGFSLKIVLISLAVLVLSIIGLVISSNLKKKKQA